VIPPTLMITVWSGPAMRLGVVQQGDSRRRSFGRPGDAAHRKPFGLAGSITIRHYQNTVCNADRPRYHARTPDEPSPLVSPLA
jgi:hypothetical protein